MSFQLLIADDHAVVRAGIRVLLTGTVPGVHIVEAADGLDAWSIASRQSFDLALLDVSMPGLNGLEVARRISRAQPDCRVVMLSMHRDEERVAQAIRAGASGYVLKEAAVDEVALAIDTVRRGDVFISPGLTRAVDHLIERNDEQGPLSVLTARQREILQLIAEGQSTKEIAFRLEVSAKTVETHRRMLMERLGIFDIAGLARFALRSGIVSA